MRRWLEPGEHDDIWTNSCILQGKLPWGIHELTIIQRPFLVMHVLIQVTLVFTEANYDVCSAVVPSFFLVTRTHAFQTATTAKFTAPQARFRPQPTNHEWYVPRRWHFRLVRIESMWVNDWRIAIVIKEGYGVDFLEGLGRSFGIWT